MVDLTAPGRDRHGARLGDASRRRRDPGRAVRRRLTTRVLLGRLTLRATSLSVVTTRSASP